TTELADDLVGGVLSAGPHRLEAAGAAGIPQVVSLGALDMVNFGPREHVPDQFDERSFVVHNPTVTLMRTTPEENSRLGERIGAKLAAATGPTAVVLPAGRPERYRHRRPAVPPPAGRRRTLRRAARRPGRLRRGAGRDRAEHQRPRVRAGGRQAVARPDHRTAPTAHLRRKEQTWTAAPHWPGSART